MQESKDFGQYAKKVWMLPLDFWKSIKGITLKLRFKFYKLKNREEFLR